MNVPGQDIQHLEPKPAFFSCDLDLDPITLIHKYDLDILKMYLNLSMSLSGGYDKSKSYIRSNFTTAEVPNITPVVHASELH